MTAIHMTVAVAEWMSEVSIHAVLTKPQGNSKKPPAPHSIRLQVRRSREATDELRAAAYLRLLVEVLERERAAP